MTHSDGTVSTSAGDLILYPWQQQYPSYPTYIYTTTEPTDCRGDVHVFPCPHCKTCKCGKATLAAEKKRKG